MAGDGELVRDGRALARQAMPQRPRRSRLLLFPRDADDPPDRVIDLRLDVLGGAAVENAHHFQRERLLLRSEPRKRRLFFTYGNRYRNKRCGSFLTLGSATRCFFLLGGGHERLRLLG